MSGSGRSTRLVLLVTAADGQALDVCGPAEVFTTANLLGAIPSYSIAFGSKDGGSVRFSNGLQVETISVSSVRRKVHTLMIGGALDSRVERYPTVRDVRRIAARADRVTSVCTGAFLLAEAALLDNRTATTHWSALARLARRYPRVVVDADRIVVRDGHIWTSAGVSSGMDLALSLIAEDHGPELAREVAKWLVLYLRRPGGQAQFGDAVPIRVDAESPSLQLAPLVEWIDDHLGDDCSVERLATVALVSSRHLTRLFAQEFGTTPAKFVQGRRLDAVQTMLESSSADLATIARRCGFTRLETMHRGFRERFGVTPAQHRARFGALTN
jgi:transcriptional regulator GlxA family with amidase domain